MNGQKAIGMPLQYVQGQAGDDRYVEKCIRPSEREEEKRLAAKTAGSAVAPEEEQAHFQGGLSPRYIRPATS